MRLSYVMLKKSFNHVRWSYLRICYSIPNGGLDIVNDIAHDILNDIAIDKVLDILTKNDLKNPKNGGGVGFGLGSET